MSGGGRPARVRLIILLTVVTALSAGARILQNQQLRLPGSPAWVTTDADTLYHLRRVDRALTEGRVDSRDAFLNYPDGSPIPWPPYYTYVATAWTAPGAPEAAEARRAHVERRVASLPFVFGVLTSLLAALAARFLAGDAAALLAGGGHALASGSIAYSKLGNGDHHAWITLLAGVLLLGLSAAMRPDAPAAPRNAAALGAGLGLAAGVMMGSWVASLLYIVPIQMALGVWILRHARTFSPTLPAFGLAFHVAALAAAAPAILGSPWNTVNPWMVVNLTFFHGAWLALGAALFVPLQFLRPGGALRAYPWIVAGTLAALAAFLFLGGAGPAAGIREGFSWIGREQDFMASISESRGLIGENAEFGAVAVLGTGILLLPLVLIAGVRSALLRDRQELVPWLIAVPLLAVQALRQVRFADALAMPLAVLVAWGIVEAVRSDAVQRRLPRPLRAARIRPALRWALVAAGVVLLQPSMTGRLAAALRDGAPGSPEHPSAVTLREMADWLHVNTRPGDWSVMARWNWGHVIEWAAERPSVGTNFGTYVGDDSFRDPSRFLLSEDPAAAETLLRERRARFVALTSWLPGTVRQMVRHAAPERESRYLDPGPDGTDQLRFEWFRTVGARLMYDGAVITPDRGPVGSLAFLRLVHVSARRDPRPNPRGEPSPAGWIWEHVPGAHLTARGSPGDELAVRLLLHYPAARYETEWTSAARCGDDGIAHLRVPYTTEAPNGDGLVAEAAWRFHGRTGPLRIPENFLSGREILEVPVSE